MQRPGLFGIIVLNDLQFDEESLFAKEVDEFARKRFRLTQVAVAQLRINGPCQPPDSATSPSVCGARSEKVESASKCGFTVGRGLHACNQSAEIAVPWHVLREQDNRLSADPIQFCAENGGDADLAAFGHKFHRAVQRIRIGQRERGQIRRLRKCYNFWDGRNAVEQTPMGVEMKRNNWHAVIVSQKLSKQCRTVTMVAH